MCGRTSQRVLWYTTGRANTYVDDDTRNDPAEHVSQAALIQRWASNV